MPLWWSSIARCCSIWIPPGRAAFTATVRDLPGYWLSSEEPSVVRFEEGALPPSPDPARTLAVLAQDGQPFAYASPPGQYLHWFASSGAALT
jgi:hypothetical protein